MLQAQAQSHRHKQTDPFLIVLVTFSQLKSSTMASRVETSPPPPWPLNRTFYVIGRAPVLSPTTRPQYSFPMIALGRGAHHSYLSNSFASSKELWRWSWDHQSSEQRVHLGSARSYDYWASWFTSTLLELGSEFAKTGRPTLEITPVEHWS